MDGWGGLCGAKFGVYAGVYAGLVLATVTDAGRGEVEQVS